MTCEHGVPKTQCGTCYKMSDEMVRRNIEMQSLGGVVLRSDYDKALSVIRQLRDCFVNRACVEGDLPWTSDVSDAVSKAAELLP